MAAFTRVLIIFLIGIGALVYGVHDYITFEKSQTWLENTCQIEKSEISKLEGRTTRYNWLISYRYVYKNKLYKGDKYATNFASYTKDEAEKLAQEYPVGKVTVCYIDTSNPNVALIIRRSPFSVLFPSLMVALFFIGYGYFYAKEQLLKPFME